VLASPKKDSVNTPIEISLGWNAVSGAVSGYTLQVSQYEDFSEIIINKTNLNEIQSQVSVLKNSTNYYWRVRAYNIAGEGEWSDRGNFTTIIATPHITTPVNGVTNITTETEFRWTAVANAVSYELEISTKPDFSAEIKGFSVANDTSLTVNEFFFDKRYYTHVRAIGSTGPSQWSPVISFTTISELPSKVHMRKDFLYDTIRTDSIVLLWYSATPEVNRYL
jgi:hypothetical protein